MKLTTFSVFFTAALLSGCIPHFGESKTSDIKHVGEIVSSNTSPALQKATLNLDTTQVKTDEVFKAPTYINEQNSKMLTEINPDLTPTDSKIEIKAFTVGRDAPNGRCSSKIDRLELTGLRDEAIQNVINRNLATMAEAAEQEAQRILFGENPIYGDLCKDFSTRKYKKQDFMFDKCRANYAKHDILDISCLRFNTGGAYPSIYEDSLTINLRTGFVYQFSNLFKENSDYRNKIGQVIIGSYFPANAEDNMEIDRFKRFATNPDIAIMSFYISDTCYYGQYANWKVSSNNRCIVITNLLGTGPSRHMKFTVPLQQVKELLNPEFLNAIGPFP
jgi:hypothetical protein